MNKYWIAVASRDHVIVGVENGFMQLCHGKIQPLKRISKNDWIIYYSGKLEFGKPKICQKFTAIGQVRDEDIYQYQMGVEFCPFRRNVNFCVAQEISILPLIDKLEFIKDKKYWGLPFRPGLIEISKKDFSLISNLMLKKV